MREIFFKLILSLLFVLTNTYSHALPYALDGTWVIKEFVGESWFLDKETIKDKIQVFYKGYAKGALYNCDYEGQSSTYTEYNVTDFLKNPEFSNFKLVQEELREFNNSVLYVNRISCNGNSNPENRQVLYPFVTLGHNNYAYYLFEGGVIVLRRSEKDL
jgi:hypothetical protein